MGKEMSGKKREENMNPKLAFIFSRRSVRKYEEREVPPARTRFKPDRVHQGRW